MLNPNSQFHAAESPGLTVHAQPRLAVSFIQKKRQVWAMIITYSQFHAGRSPRIEPCSNQTFIQFHAAQAPGFIQAQPKLSVSCMQQNSQFWWSMLNPKLSWSRILSVMIHAQPTLSYNFTQHKPQVQWSMLNPNSQFHAAEFPGLMIHARPRLSRCRIPSWWSMLDPDSHAVESQVDDPCSTQTLTL